MTWRDFEYAFVHPIGPHGKEGIRKIIERKQGEIEDGKWTLWSFRNRPMFKHAHRCLSEKKVDDVYVFCTSTGIARDPGENEDNENLKCTHFKIDKREGWTSMPPHIECIQPFKIGITKRHASAFVVRKIICPDFAFFVEWMNGKGKWQQSRTGDKKKKKLPDRGEYLIRPEQNGVFLGNIRVILKLKPPYLARLKVA